MARAAFSPCGVAMALHSNYYHFVTTWCIKWMLTGLSSSVWGCTVYFLESQSREHLEQLVFPFLQFIRQDTRKQDSRLNDVTTVDSLEQILPSILINSKYYYARCGGSFLYSALGRLRQGCWHVPRLAWALSRLAWATQGPGQSRL